MESDRFVFEKGQMTADGTDLSGCSIIELTCRGKDFVAMWTTEDALEAVRAYDYMLNFDWQDLKPAWELATDIEKFADKTVEEAKAATETAFNGVQSALMGPLEGIKQLLAEIWKWVVFIF